MAISLKSVRKAGGMKPPIGILYGKPGIGKTTFAACTPSPIFLQTEDGLVNPALSWVPTFGVVSSYDDFMQAIGVVGMNASTEGWSTLVIDSIDRLAPLITDFVCQQNGWTKLEDGKFGQGKIAYVEEWRKFMTVLIELRNQCGVGVLMLAHHKAVRLTPPDAEPYTQYSLTLPEDVSRILIGDSDFVFFATHPITTSSTNVGFKKTFTRGTIDKARVYTQERGSHLAKNRFDMPEFVPFEWDVIKKYVPRWADAAQPQAIAEYIAQQPASPAGDEPAVEEVTETAGEMVAGE